LRQGHIGVIEPVEQPDGTGHRHHQIGKSQNVGVDYRRLFVHGTSVGERGAMDQSLFAVSCRVCARSARPRRSNANIGARKVHSV